MSSPSVVFLVGAPRSGTTWLQHLLGAHPRIATRQETDLLNETWPERFSPYDRWLFDRVAGDLLVELGYELDRVWVGGTGTSRALARSRHAAARASYRGHPLLRR